ncbi:hypothetical protein HYX09_06170 [Candidatus Woesearchaeota archaeon]|nr:hypothetical protein [Candidatus Woesearchaeota archaeon]
MAGNGASYKIPDVVMHYRGIPAIPDVRLLDKVEPSKSFLSAIPMGTFSYGQGSEPLYVIKTNENGQTGAFFRTANNIFFDPIEDFKKEGNFFGNDDEIDLRYGSMKGWKEAGEDLCPALFDVVPPLPELIRHIAREHLNLDIEVPEGIIEGTPKILNMPHPRDTKVYLYTTPTHYLVSSFNDVGKKLSQSENMRQLMINYALDYREMHRGEPNPEALAYSEHLKANGFRNPKKLAAYGVMEGDFIAATSYLPNTDEVFLIINRKFEGDVNKFMEKYGIDGRIGMQYVIDSIFNHERTHFFKKAQGGASILRKIKVERLVGRMLEKFYSERSKIVNGEDAAIYRKLAQENKDYQKGITRHHLRELLLGQSHKGDKYKALEETLKSEAIAMGLEEGEIDSYVERKISEYAATESLGEITESSGKSIKENTLEAKVAKSGKHSRSRSASSGENPGGGFFSSLLSMFADANIYDTNKSAEDGTEQEYESGHRDDAESDNDAEAEGGESGAEQE